ncbi:MAG: DUF3872 domain-containing protein [Bacteroidales bacterium]|nr:DUF3872 domain-containing protein [Bacteroidales bacterium]
MNAYLYLSKTTYGPKKVDVHTFSEKLKDVTEKTHIGHYYTSASSGQQTIGVYMEDRFKQLGQFNLSFNNDSSKEDK